MTNAPRITPEGLRPETDISKWVWFLPAAVLLVAILPLPYVYYIGMRWIVAAAAAFLAWKEYTLNDNAPNSYVWAFGFIALLFNPLIPVHLFKLLWIIINVATAAIFVGHYKLCLRSA